MTEFTALGVLALLDALTLLVTSLLLVYPVVRYSSNVAHTGGFVSLSTAFVLLTAAAVDGVLFGPGLRISLLVSLASLFGLVGTASFARPFLSLRWLPPAAHRLDDSSSNTPEPAAYEKRFEQGGDR